MYVNLKFILKGGIILLFSSRKWFRSDIFHFSHEFLVHCLFVWVGFTALWFQELLEHQSCTLYPRILLSYSWLYYLNFVFKQSLLNEQSRHFHASWYEGNIPRTQGQWKFYGKCNVGTSAKYVIQLKYGSNQVKIIVSFISGLHCCWHIPNLE